MSDHHLRQRKPSIVTTERRMYDHAAMREKPCGPYPEGHLYEMFETDYTTWKAQPKKIDPRTTDSVIVLKDPPGRLERA
ncbi:hypothetical protein Hte_003950 [Hypoxylon texense]